MNNMMVCMCVLQASALALWRYGCGLNGDHQIFFSTRLSRLCIRIRVTHENLRAVGRVEGERGQNVVGHNMTIFSIIYGITLPLSILIMKYISFVVLSPMEHSISFNKTRLGGEYCFCQTNTKHSMWQTLYSNILQKDAIIFPFILFTLKVSTFVSWKNICSIYKEKKISKNMFVIEYLFSCCLNLIFVAELYCSTKIESDHFLTTNNFYYCFTIIRLLMEKPAARWLWQQSIL